MNKKYCLGLMSLILSITLCSCSTKPKKLAPSTQPVSQYVSAEDKWQWRLQYLQNIQHWQMEGRISATQNNEGGNASFVWKQLGESYQIKFFGPFGAGAVYVTGSPYQVTLVEADGKEHHAQSADALMHKVAGWQVPLDGIRYWMLGMPIPRHQVDSQTLRDDGSLNNLKQLGWHIQYKNYHQDKSPMIPAKIDLVNGPLKIKIIIKNLRELNK